MKILAAIPLECDPEKNESWWFRDMGLVVTGLRKLGHEAYLVAHQKPGTRADDRPFIPATREEMSSAGWWKAQKPDAIIINTWSAPRHHAIRLAASAACKRVIEKLDTDGVKSPWIWPWHYVRRDAVAYELDKGFFARGRAFARAMARVLVVGGGPKLLDEKMVRCMESVPVYAAETPLAAERVRRFLRMYHADPMPRVEAIPHPANQELMQYDNTPKENIVICVGRWNDAVKGWPLLVEIAARFLQVRKDWRVCVAGPDADPKDPRLEKLGDTRGRFEITGKLDHQSLARLYRRAKIFLLTSHSETFNIAGAEALCAGCSVVGPSQIPSSAYFASRVSGTVSHVRNADHMADALLAEASEWDAGRRNATLISSEWGSQLGDMAVARRYVDIFNSMET